MPERRPARRVKCVFDGCDTYITTAEYVGGPHFVQDRPKEVVMAEAEAHMEAAHYGPARKVFT